MRVEVLAACLLLISGCFGQGSNEGADPGNSQPLEIPADYAIAGAELVERNKTSVHFRWAGTAPAGALLPSGSNVEVTPAVELEVPVPQGLPLLFDAALGDGQAGTASLGFWFIQLQVIDSTGRLRCNEYQPGQCRIGAGPVDVEETWRVRVLSERNADPAQPFVVDLSWSVFVPKTVAELPPRQAFQPEPHSLIAIADSGINPYHEVFYRPDRTQHPCTYIQDFPCSVRTLNLSVGIYDDLETAIAADHAAWAAVEPDTWYWVPRTAIVAASCPTPTPSGSVAEGALEVAFDFDQPECLLETYAHGTGTASSVVMENPDALLVITQAPERGGLAALASSKIPFDLYSYSYGPAIPVVSDDERTAGACQENTRAAIDRGRLFLVPSGNWAHSQPPLGPASTLTDCWTGDPYVITVGGAYASDQTQDPLAAWHPEVVSWFRRPVAQHDSITGYVEVDGTSFGTPTVAGALSKVILDIRRSSGYLGSVHDGVVDPVLGISNADLRTAMNLTATYSPQAQYNSTGNGVPLNPVAPWQQWAWGFYDGTVADATVAHLLGETTASKPAGAVQWMETQHEAKRQLWGS